MKYLIFLLPLLLHGAVLLDTSLYERQERVDLLLSFDAPFEGTILTQEKPGDLYLKLTGVSGQAKEPVALTSSFVKSIDYFFSGNELYVHAQTKEGVTLQADKTADGHGVRIRLLKPTAEAVAVPEKNVAAPGPEKKRPVLGENRPDMGSKYVAAAIFVAALLTVYALFLLFRRKRSGGWLFGGANAPKQEIQVITQRVVDAKNRVALIRYNGMNYLVLIGATNLVIDKFPMTGEKAEKRFGELLKSSEERLDGYLNDDDRMLERYKRKASRQGKPMGKTS